MMGTFFEDVRYGLRAMLRARGPTLVAVLTLPVGDPDRLTVLYARSRDTRDYRNFSYADYADLRQVRGFESLAAVQAARVGASGSIDNAVLWGELVSPNYFETLGVRCVLGKAFTEGEHAPNVILSYRTWQRRFGAG